MRRLVLLAVLALQSVLARADWVADPSDPEQVKAASAVARIREAAPELEAYFKNAYAYAVFPQVVRLGLFFGGARGQGVVIAADRLLGEVTQSSVTLGFQAGGQSYSQIIFFRSPEALELFVARGNLGRFSGRLEFAGRASAVVAEAGGAVDPGFSSDVAIFSQTGRGIMLELAAGTVRYLFTPASESSPVNGDQNTELMADPPGDGP